MAEPFAFEVDQEVLMYFNGAREFMQQMGRVVEIVEPGHCLEAPEHPDCASVTRSGTTPPSRPTGS